MKTKTKKQLLLEKQEQQAEAVLGSIKRDSKQNSDETVSFIFFDLNGRSRTIKVPRSNPLKEERDAVSLVESTFLT